MKVLMVNKFFFSKGGAETVYFQEREMLTKAGFEVCELSMKHEKNFPSKYEAFFVENVDYHGKNTISDKIKTAINFIHNSEACTKLLALLNKEKPEIVHFHNIYHQLTPSIIRVAKEFGCKTLLTSHDYKVACPNYSMLVDKQNFDITKLQGSFLNLFKYRWQEGSRSKSLLLGVEAAYHQFKKSYQAVDLFIAPSEFMGEMIQARLPNAQVKVIVNGIDIDESEVAVEDQGYFLFLGRLMEEKGVETLAKAQNLMKHDAELKFAGDGPLYDHLKANYPKAKMLGFQSGDTLIDLIKNCKAVVVPSEWYENCSMSVLEAMAYKKPVLGAKIGGIPEQIRDGVDGYLFTAGDAQDLADKMDKLMETPTLAKELGENARQRLIEKYSLQTHQKEIIKIYHSLIAKG